MKKLILLAGMVAFLLSSCTKDSQLTFDDANLDLNEAEVTQVRGVIHQVSAGTNDVCEAFGLEPGCDKSFSLTAKMFANGSVKGQWVDGFGGDDGGIHVSIDCLEVFGNAAIIGGVITKVKKGTPSFYQVGDRATTAVVDNGTSQKDLADQISASFSGDFCGQGLAPANFPLFDVGPGQVKVK